jgi:hypothetical protein
VAGGRPALESRTALTPVSCLQRHEARSAVDEHDLDWVRPRLDQRPIRSAMLPPIASTHASSSYLACSSRRRAMGETILQRYKPAQDDTNLYLVLAAASRENIHLGIFREIVLLNASFIGRRIDHALARSFMKNRVECDEAVKA